MNIPRLELALVKHLITDAASVVAPALNGGTRTEVSLVRVSRKTGALVFFACPSCGKRARYLYNVGGAWACATCHSLDDNPNRHLSNKRRHERQITKLEARIPLAKNDAERTYLAAKIEGHKAALATPARPIWGAARRQRMEKKKLAKDPQYITKMLYGNRSHRAGQKTPHSQIAYDRSEPLPRVEDANEDAAHDTTHDMHNARESGAYPDMPYQNADGSVEKLSHEQWRARIEHDAEIARRNVRFNGVDDLGQDGARIRAMFEWSQW